MMECYNHNVTLLRMRPFAWSHPRYSDLFLGRRLKTLRGLTPYQYIRKCWTSEPYRFSLNPHHQMPGPNSLRRTD